MPAVDTETRRIAGRILVAQLAVTVIVAVVAYVVAGALAGGSAALGGGIGITANLYMTLTSLRPSSDARQAVRRLYVGQAIKVVLTLAMFIAAAMSLTVSWPAMLVAYVATLLAFWWVPFRAAMR
jgi:F0F1-type ATP synthase, subunit I